MRKTGSLKESEVYKSENPKREIADKTTENKMKGTQYNRCLIFCIGEVLKNLNNYHAYIDTESVVGF